MRRGSSRRSNAPCASARQSVVRSLPRRRTNSCARRRCCWRIPASACWCRRGGTRARQGWALRARVSGTKQSNAQVAKGMLGLDTLVQFKWEVSLGGETISREEFQRLAALKMPLVQVRGQWVELRPRRDRCGDAVLARRRARRPHCAMRCGCRSMPRARRTAYPSSEVVTEGWVHELLDELRGDATLQRCRSRTRLQDNCDHIRRKALRGWLDEALGTGRVSGRRHGTG